MIGTVKILPTKCRPIATRIATSKVLPTPGNNYQNRSPNVIHHIIIPRSISTFLQEYKTNFQHLEPKRKVQHSGLLTQKYYIDCLNIHQRSFIFGRKKPKPNKKRIPRLILLQNPLTWLLVKIDFCVLRHVWDPHFQENDFKFGTKQAISRVTNLISDGQYAELNGLLTKPARLSLLRELDRNWNDKQRSLLALKRDDIQISSPRRVHFIRIADKKFCDVDMAFLALKWAPINTSEALLFTEIFARFHREYTPYSIPEWTIAFFKVTRFEVLRKRNKS